MKQDFNICGLSPAPGEKISDYVQVGQVCSMPVTVINGAGRGKTLLITAGIHGGEYPGIQTATELAQEVDPGKIRGQIVIVHCVNTAAFYQRVSYISPLDGKNINRLFPGDAGGSAGDQTARFLTENFHKKADFYLDLHGGDIHEKLPPYVYCPSVGEDKRVLETARKAAEYINAEYMVMSTATTGAYNSRAILGIPSLLLERGGQGQWSRRQVDRYKEDVINIMRFLGMVDEKPVLPQKPAVVLQEVVYLDSDLDGCWYACADIREKVEKGQRIGYIRDIFGNVIKEYYAEFDAVVLYVAISLAITKGTRIITYGR